MAIRRQRFPFYDDSGSAELCLYNREKGKELAILRDLDTAFQTFRETKDVSGYGVRYSSQVPDSLAATPRNQSASSEDEEDLSGTAGQCGSSMNFGTQLLRQLFHGQTPPIVNLVYGGTGIHVGSTYAHPSPSSAGDAALGEGKAAVSHHRRQPKRQGIGEGSRQQRRTGGGQANPRKSRISQTSCQGRVRSSSPLPRRPPVTSFARPSGFKARPRYAIVVEGLARAAARARERVSARQGTADATQERPPARQGRRPRHPSTNPKCVAPSRIPPPLSFPASTAFCKSHSRQCTGENTAAWQKQLARRTIAPTHPRHKQDKSRSMTQKYRQRSRDRSSSRPSRQRKPKGKERHEPHHLRHNSSSVLAAVDRFLTGEVVQMLNAGGEHEETDGAHRANSYGASAVRSRRPEVVEVRSRAADPPQVPSQSQRLPPKSDRRVMEPSGPPGLGRDRPCGSSSPPSHRSRDRSTSSGNVQERREPPIPAVTGPYSWERKGGGWACTFDMTAPSARQRVREGEGRVAVDPTRFVGRYGMNSRPVRPGELDPSHISHRQPYIPSPSLYPEPSQPRRPVTVPLPPSQSRSGAPPNSFSQKEHLSVDQREAVLMDKIAAACEEELHRQHG